MLYILRFEHKYGTWSAWAGGAIDIVEVPPKPFSPQPFTNNSIFLVTIGPKIREFTSGKGRLTTVHAVDRMQNLSRTLQVSFNKVTRYGRGGRRYEAFSCWDELGGLPAEIVPVTGSWTDRELREGDFYPCTPCLGPIEEREDNEGRYLRLKVRLRQGV